MLHFIIIVFFQIVGSFLFKALGWVDWSYPFILLIIGIVVVCYIGLGVLLFKYKNSRYKNTYGAIEVGIGALSGLLGVIALFNNESVKPFLVFLVFFSSLYVIVRGLESIQKSYLDNVNLWKKSVEDLINAGDETLPSPPKKAKFIFFTISEEEEVVKRFKETGNIE